VNVEFSTWNGTKSTLAVAYVLDVPVWRRRAAPSVATGG
jgi:hypothetical protein